MNNWKEFKNLPCCDIGNGKMAFLEVCDLYPNIVRKKIVDYKGRGTGKVPYKQDKSYYLYFEMDKPQIMYATIRSLKHGK